MKFTKDNTILNTSKNKNQAGSALLLALLLLTLTSLASATTWTQYNPSPTTNEISIVRTYGMYAMALTDNQNILYFNGTTWQEIGKPVAYALSSGETGISFDKAGDGNFYWAFSDGTKIDVYQFIPSTQTWTLDKTTNSGQALRNSGTTFHANFACLKTSNKCYAILANSSIYGVKTGTANPDPKVTEFIKGQQYLFSIKAGEYSMNTGFSWSILSGLTTLSPADVSQPDINYIYFFTRNGASSYALYKFNQTSGVFDFVTSQASAESVYVATEPSTLGAYFPNIAGNKSQHYTSNYFSNTMQTDYTFSNRIRSMDFDSSNYNGWAGGENGRLYSTGLITPPSTTYSITTNPSQDPTTFGASVGFNSQITNTLATTSTITQTIYNKSGTYLQQGSTTIHGSGSATIITISSSLWQYFPAGQYYIQTTATDGSHNANANTTFTITLNATTNSTNYSNTGYTTATNYTNIIGVDALGNNNLFAVGKLGSAIKIISADVTNPNNPNIKAKTIATGADDPTSISIGDSTRIYVGTNNKVYVLNGSQTADATQTTENAPSIGVFGASQYVGDISAKDDQTAFACEIGFISDNVREINVTSNSATTTYSESPCKTSEYDNNLLFIHKETNGVKIYNTTSNALLSTISGISTYPSGATHDVITTYSNYLFIVSGATQITKYDITNPSSPVKVADCYTNYQVQSIEALGTDEVIVGTVSDLRICDFANPDKYDPASAKYLSTQIKHYTNSENPQEIKRMNTNGKYAVAEGNGIGIYFYAKNQIVTPTNNPPVISSVNPSPVTPCVNQTATITVMASDAENDALTYDLDCNGVQAIMLHNYISNVFSCTYTSSGTKTVKAWTRDLTNPAVLSTLNLNVQVCNFTNFLSFKVYDFDNPSTPVANALANVVGQTSDVTDTAGLVSFNLPTAGTYTVTFSASGYVDVTKTYTTSNGNYIVYLKSNSVQPDSNLLQVTVNNKAGLPVENALVSATDPITAIAKTSSTDANGLALLDNLVTGVEMRISAGKTGYVPTFATTSINNGESKKINVTLYQEGETIKNLTSRGCQDFIEGRILCSPLNTSRNGDSCLVDADCITGRCQAPKGGTQRSTCSNFNWTYCDANGYSRGTTCYSKAMAESVGQNITASILDNLMYWMGAGVILFVIIIIVVSFRKNN